MAEAKKGAAEKPKETAAAAFARLGNARGNRVLASINVLGKLANGRYEYSPAQIASLFGAIETAVAKCRASFEQPTTRRKAEPVKLV